MDAGGAINPEGVFGRPLELRDGIYRALAEKPRVPLAQRSNFWPLTAALYEPLWRGRSISLLTRGAFSTERELERMLAQLEPRPGERILDAGTSAGLYARTLLKYDETLSIHALDFSLPFLEKAKVYAEREGVRPLLVHADVRALPYRDAVFDAVVCGGSLNEFTDLSGTLAEFARVLKPGGQFWLMALTGSQGKVGQALQGLLGLSGLRFFSLEELEASVQAAGFEPRSMLLHTPVTLTLFRLTLL